MSEAIQTFVLAGHILVGILLVTIILVQRGKGSDAGMSFGGGASGTVFGAAGSGTFLTKTTKWLAIAFFGTSLALAYVHNNKTAPTSILDKVEDVQQQGESSPIAAPLPTGVSDVDVAPKLELTSPEGVDVTATPAGDAIVDGLADAQERVEGAVSDVQEAAEELTTEEPEGE